VFNRCLVLRFVPDYIKHSGVQQMSRVTVRSWLHKTFWCSADVSCYGSFLITENILVFSRSLVLRFVPDYIKHSGVQQISRVTVRFWLHKTFWCSADVSYYGSFLITENILVFSRCLVLRFVPYYRKHSGVQQLSRITVRSWLHKRFWCSADVSYYGSFLIT
jgi:hypothetical protein